MSEELTSCRRWTDPCQDKLDLSYQFKLDLDIAGLRSLYIYPTSDSELSPFTAAAAELYILYEKTLSSPCPSKAKSRI